MIFRIVFTLLCITWTAAYAQDAAPLTKPTLTYPADGEEVATATPVLEAEIEDFKRTGQAWVRFELYSDSSLKNLIAKEDITLGNESLIGWATENITLEEDTRYFWRAKIVTEQAEGDWSLTSDFVINAVNEPTPVAVALPTAVPISPAGISAAPKVASPNVAVESAAMSTTSDSSEGAAETPSEAPEAVVSEAPNAIVSEAPEASVSNAAAPALSSSGTADESTESDDGSSASASKKPKADLKTKLEKAAAKAAKRKSKYPVSGIVGTAYTANHANFVESGGDFGTQLLSINGGINYAAHRNLVLSTGVSTRKSIVNDFLSRGAGTSTSEQPWEIGDVSIGASFGSVYTIPSANIDITAGSSLSFPLSRTSQAFGMIAAGTANTALGWRKGQFNVGLSLRATYNWTEEATIPVDCVRAPDICRISGADTGIPVSLINYGTGISAGYSFLDGKLNVSTNYGLASGISAAKFEDDDNTAPYAQSGTQYGNLAQSFGITTAYRVFKKTNVALIMRTAGTFFTNDNKSWRFPLFDTESDLHQRTSYTLSVTQSF